MAEAPQRIVGWVTLTTLVGLSLGFAVVDLSAGQAGCNWRHFTYIWPTIQISGAAALIGTGVGLFFESRLSRSSRSGEIMLWGYEGFAVALILFTFLRPAFQNAR
jgi:hypothetical protein